MFSCKNINLSVLRIIIVLSLLPFFAVQGNNGSGRYTQNDTLKNSEAVYENTLKAYQDSIETAEKHKLPERKAYLNQQLGKIHLRAGHYTEAFTCFFSSLEIRRQENLNADDKLGETYALLGESYRAITQFDNSLEYLNKALQIFNDFNNMNGVAYVRNRLASVYYEIAVNRRDTAMMLTAENETYSALRISKDLGLKELTVSNYNILGAIHNFTGSTEEGRTFLLTALSESESIPAYMDAPNILNNIANSYLLDKNYVKAIEYAEKSFIKANSTGIKIYELVALRILTESYSGSGDYRKAYEYLLKYNNKNSTLFNEKMESDVQSIKKKYDIELERQLRASEKNRNLILITAITIFLILIGLGILLRIRGIQRINKDLEAQRDTIARQKEDLEKINAMKDKYFSILSHDLRNPLSGISGFANMLDSGYKTYTDEEKKEYIGYIKASSESMYRVIEKVLTWSRLQSHSIKAHEELFALRPEVDNILNLQRPNASKKGIILENGIAEDTTVFSDKSIIDTVITNLIDNAVKFTREGGRISINSELYEGKLRISVDDNGVGMSEKAIESVLSLHTMITTRGTKNEKGTGFGLSICVEMLELIGTKLNIESKIGEGAKFFFFTDNKT